MSHLLLSSHKQQILTANYTLNSIVWNICMLSWIAKVFHDKIGVGILFQLIDFLSMFPSIWSKSKIILALFIYMYMISKIEVSWLVYHCKGVHLRLQWYLLVVLNWIIIIDSINYCQLFCQSSGVWKSRVPFCSS